MLTVRTAADAFLDSLRNPNTVRSYATGVGKTAERIGESRPPTTPNGRSHAQSGPSSRFDHPEGSVMSESAHHNGLIPTGPNHFFTTVLTCIFLAKGLTWEQVEAVGVLVPLALQLFPDRR